jgi:hypothetical protein
MSVELLVESSETIFGENSPNIQQLLASYLGIYRQKTVAVPSVNALPFSLNFPVLVTG